MLCLTGTKLVFLAATPREEAQRRVPMFCPIRVARALQSLSNVETVRGVHSFVQCRNSADVGFILSSDVVIVWAYVECSRLIAGSAYARFIPPPLAGEGRVGAETIETTIC